MRLPLGIEIDEQALAKLPPAEQEEFAAALAEIQRSFDENPLQTYRPYPKQHEFHSQGHRTRAFFGGNRTGKTTAGAADDLIQALPPDWVPKHLLPYKKFGFDRPFRGRVITPDLAFTMEAVLDKFREMTPPATLLGGGWDKAFDKTKRILRFDRGDRIDFMSTEQDPDKFGGVALHRVHFDEEPGGPHSKKIYRDSRMRLVDYGGDLLFTMTPLLGKTWVNDEIWEEAEKGSSRVFAVRASMKDNPHLSPEEIDEALADLTFEERKAVEHGGFVHFEGEFYDEFTPELHVIPAPEPETLKDWDVVVAIDPGSRTGVVWVGFDADNKALVFDEFYPLGQVVPDIATEIHRRNRAWDINPAYVIDPAARIRTGPSQEQFTTEYVRHKIFATAGQNARGPGIMEVKRRLQKGSLFISEECRSLIWEFGRYRKDPNSPDEWAAIKTDDHLLDACRYAVMERTWARPPLKTRRRSNYNSYNPNFQSPYRPPTPEAPPLGAMS